MINSFQFFLSKCLNFKSSEKFVSKRISNIYLLSLELTISGHSFLSHRFLAQGCLS